METKLYETKVFGKECMVDLIDFSKADRAKWKELFDLWMRLKLGMRDYKAREPNFPEGLSEVAFCLYSGSKKLFSLQGPVSSSFDTYNLETKRAEQIKATSVKEDLTSFGPDSEWDDLYFLDFYNKGKLDGTFNIYIIPNDLIYNYKVNKNQTLKQQQAQGKRPRFSLTKELIIKKGLKPIATNVKVW
jgi:hypothetical protein